MSLDTRSVGTLPEGDAYRPRRLLMCRPEYFAVTYEINPWMNATVPVNRDRAIKQWERLVRVYKTLGHTVELVEPVRGLPDMVFAANSALVIDGRVYPARFRYSERRGEEHPYAEWFAANGFGVTGVAACTNEGEGDFATVGGFVLGGYGFRTDIASHDELRTRLGVDVVSLRLVDPRYYHLDTALSVLSDDNIAYNPMAFDPAAQHWLNAQFPHAVLVDEHDAAAFGCNAFSDGHHVVVSARAVGFQSALRARGYEPVPVDLSEFKKSGGSVKCCTLELRADPGDTP